jgi:hypothetical protein
LKGIGKDNGGNDKDVTIKQGLRQNLSQFVILIVVNAFVGAMVGLEQTVVPLIGKDIFSIQSMPLFYHLLQVLDL